MDQIVLEPESKTFTGWRQSQKFWMPGAGDRNLSFGSTALVPTTANLAPGFLSASFFKAGWRFHRSCSCHDNCGIYYACAALG